MDFWLNHPKTPTLIEMVEKPTLGPSILSIRGNPQSGKRMLGDWLQAHAFVGSIFWIRPKSVYGSNSMLDSLSEGMSSTNLKARNDFQAFKKAWNDYKTNGSYSEENCIDDWIKILNTRVFSALEIKDPPKLIFFLDDYSKWAVTAKDWFSGFVKQFLGKASPNCLTNFILTGENSLQNSLEIEDYWEPWKASLVELDWHALTKEDLEKIFKKVGIPKDLVKDLYRETKGLPGPVFKKLDLLTESRQQTTVDPKIEGRLKKLSALQYKTILLLAHRGSLDSESIYCLLEQENSRDLVDSIDSDQVFSLRRKRFPIELKREDRVSILTWQKLTKPEEYLSYQRKVDAYQRLHEQLPERDLRDALRILGLFEDFHEALLVAVFSDQGNGLWQLVENNARLFMPTYNGYRVKDRLREDIKTSGFGINAKKLSSIKKNAHTYWLTYKKEMEKEYQTVSQKIDELKKQEKKTRHSFQKIMKKIHQYQKNFVKSFKGNHRRFNDHFITVAYVRNSFLFPFILALMGFFFLYLSLLYKDFAVAYLIAGLVSLGAGFVISSRASFRKTKKRKKIPQKNIDNALKNDSFNKLLGLHKDALMQKKSGLEKTIKRLTRDQESLETIIKNAFIR